jgi:hypothetical protein
MQKRGNSCKAHHCIPLGKTFENGLIEFGANGACDLGYTNSFGTSDDSTSHLGRGNAFTPVIEKEN